MKSATQPLELHTFYNSRRREVPISDYALLENVADDFALSSQR